MATSSRAYIARAEDLEAQLSQSQTALSEARRRLQESLGASAHQQQQWEEERASLTEGFRTQLGKTSEELRDCMRALATLRKRLETANALVIAVDRTGYLEEMNRKAVEIFGSSI